MSSLIIGILIIIVFFGLFIITTLLNQNYKKDVNVRGFVGNCEKCGTFSCHKHPLHDEKMKELEEEDE